LTTSFIQLDKIDVSSEGSVGDISLSELEVMTLLLEIKICSHKMNRILHSTTVSYCSSTFVDG
jgi:hypothetical protein